MYFMQTKNLKLTNIKLRTIRLKVFLSSCEKEDFQPYSSQLYIGLSLLPLGEQKLQYDVMIFMYLSQVDRHSHC